MLNRFGDYEHTASKPPKIKSYGDDAVQGILPGTLDHIVEQILEDERLKEIKDSSIVPFHANEEEDIGPELDEDIGIPEEELQDDNPLEDDPTIPIEEEYSVIEKDIIDQIKDSVERPDEDAF